MQNPRSIGGLFFLIKYFMHRKIAVDKLRGFEMDTQFAHHHDDYREDTVVAAPPHQSAVAWPAIFAGAVASAALSLILLLLGAGLGLTLVSPWSGEGISGANFGLSSILGITLISLLASAMGGYIAGRLRTRWANTPNDEVFFRDTAHGFLSWSVATLGTAAVLTGVIGAIIGGGVKATAEVAGTIASGAATALVAGNGGDNAENKESNTVPMQYMLDSLLRNENSALSANSPPSSSSEESAPGAVALSSSASVNGKGDLAIPKGEIARIFMNAITTGSLPESDLKYTAQLVSDAADIDQKTAEKRVTDAFAALQAKLQDAETLAREAADKARELSAKTSLWLFISLLIGAFIASLMAVYGGRQRDL